MKVRPGVELASLSDVGCQRENNEDRYSYWEPASDPQFPLKGRLAIVADGMGGYEGGQEASRIAVEVIEEAYANAEAGDPRTWLLRGLSIRPPTYTRVRREVSRPARNGDHLYGNGPSGSSALLSHTWETAACIWCAARPSHASPMITPTSAGWSRMAFSAQKKLNLILSGIFLPLRWERGATSLPILPPNLWLSSQEMCCCCVPTVSGVCSTKARFKARSRARPPLKFATIWWTSQNAAVDRTTSPCRSCA